jgi:hypothetical protein
MMSDLRAAQATYVYGCDPLLLAAHEAAHAIMAFCAGFHIGEVSVEADARSSGHCSHYLDTDDRRSIEEIAAARALVALAPSAVGMFASPDWNQFDEAIARTYAAAVASGPVSEWLAQVRRPIPARWSRLRAAIPFGDFVDLVRRRGTLPGPEAEAWCSIWIPTAEAERWQAGMTRAERVEECIRG